MKYYGAFLKLMCRRVIKFYGIWLKITLRNEGEYGNFSKITRDIFERAYSDFL
jgi:hypothetical protein